MKNWPLSYQISAVFSMLIIIIGISLIAFIPGTLRSFFTNEIFTTIEQSQQLVNINDQSSNKIAQEKLEQNARLVSHILIDEEGLVLRGSSLPSQTLNAFFRQAVAQPHDVGRYEATVQSEEKIFYVIRKRKLGSLTIYQISYMWDSYRQELVQTLFDRLMVIMVFVLFGGLFLALLFAKWLSKPIVQMKKHVHHIAERQWDEPLSINRQDELGILAASIEKMRIQLMEQDKAQQTTLQHISHDLKTPVMVIRSYAQAIRDGVYPNGTLEHTAETIEQESQRLEQKIKDLLYLTKLDYIAQQKTQHKAFSLKDLVDEVYSLFKNQRSDVNIERHLIDQKINGDREQWKVAFENIVDNAIRYARQEIKIEMNKVDDTVLVRIWNDGPKLSEETIEKLFQPYTKGKNGNFGLGLTIVKRTMDIHNARVYVKNEQQGVAFYFEISMTG